MIDEYSISVEDVVKLANEYITKFIAMQAELIRTTPPEKGKLVTCALTVATGAIGSTFLRCIRNNVDDDTYIQICELVLRRSQGMHVHEVTQEQMPTVRA